MLLQLARAAKEDPSLRQEACALVPASSEPATAEELERVAARLRAEAQEQATLIPVGSACLRALGNLAQAGAPAVRARAEQALIAALADAAAPPALQVAAASALGASCGAQAREALGKAAQGEPSPIRMAARAAIQRCQRASAPPRDLRN
jgi:hypothetical protein